MASRKPRRARAADDASGATTSRLLDAAERLFAERGFAATSVRDITRAAGTNVAAVNYHFGGKSALYRAIFDRRLAELRDLRLAAIESTLAERPAPGLERLLERFAGAFLEPLLSGDAGRSWIALYSREMLDPQLPPALIYDEILKPTHDAMGAALRRVVPALDRETALLSVQSLTGQLLHVRRLSAIAAGAPSAAARRLYSVKRLLGHVIGFSAAAIRQLERQRS